MKKLFLSLMIVLLFSPLAFAETKDVERQQSEFYEVDNLATDDEVIKSSAGTVFGVTMSATAANGWVAVYDVASTSDITSSSKPKIEVQTATQYNTEKKDFNSGIKFYNGITVEGDNAQGIIYYY